MTRRTPNSQIITEDVLFVHPDDAENKGVADDDYVMISSARGTTRMKVKLTDVVKPGVIYTTFHFPEASINYLTGSIADEFTLTPEYKVVAVDFEKSVFSRYKIAECDS